MKCLRVLVSVFVALLMGAAVCMAAGSGDVPMGPLACGVITVTTLNPGTAAVSSGTICMPSQTRVDGYIVNMSTNYVRLNFAAVHSTTTAGSYTAPTQAVIDATYTYLAPFSTANFRDTFFFDHDNHVYRGGVFYDVYETDLATRGSGRVTCVEWK